MQNNKYPLKHSSEGAFVLVRGARQHNLKNVNVDIPRNMLVVFTGISGSGKSSLAFGTLYGEAQRRYLESVSPYARRLFNQMPVPDVDSVDGLPPAVALQQQRGSSSTRSSVGSVTTLANLIRMLYSRAGNYPVGQGILYAESFSSNTPEGACENCHGLGKVYSVTEQSMVPDDSLTIRQRAVAAWPLAWYGQNLREILMTLGHDVDIPWKDLSKKTRNWILFTKEQPTVPVYSGLSLEQVQRAHRSKATPSYMGTFSSAERYVMHTFSHTESPSMKKRVAQYMISSACPVCQGKRLKLSSLSVTFAGRDITELSSLALKDLYKEIAPYAQKSGPANQNPDHPEKDIVAQRICADLLSRLEVMLDLGLGYLTMERATPTLSPGELQRLRLATQIRSNLFGVVYVLDEPSAGLHPVDTQALLKALRMLNEAGNSIFVVEHALDVIKQADWIVDVGPEAGEGGGEILYSGPLEGLKDIAQSYTKSYLFGDQKSMRRELRAPRGHLSLRGITRNNLIDLDIDFPLGVFTSVTGVSGSGKSTLVSQLLVQLVEQKLGIATEDDDSDEENQTSIPPEGSITDGMQHIKRLIKIDQKPIGRTPRSNLATYTGLFDHIRKVFAALPSSRKARYTASRFSFNVAEGRCKNCVGEGFVMVELLFLPSVYSPCPVCEGARYNQETLAIKLRDLNISDVLHLTVKEACNFFAEDALIMKPLNVLRDVGLGYLRLGQSATELSGGEAQRIKLATELQKGYRGQALYILDEPTTGLHSADVDRLLTHLHALVDAGNSVIVVEHNMRVVATSDWVIDIGPGAGDEGGKIVVAGIPSLIVKSQRSKTAPFLTEYLE